MANVAAPQNKKAQKIAEKIMGRPVNRPTEQDLQRTALELKRETSTLVRS